MGRSQLLTWVFKLNAKNSIQTRKKLSLLYLNFKLFRLVREQNRNPWFYVKSYLKNEKGDENKFHVYEMRYSRTLCEIGRKQLKSYQGKPGAHEVKVTELNMRN